MKNFCFQLVVGGGWDGSNPLPPLPISLSSSEWCAKRTDMPNKLYYG